MLGYVLKLPENSPAASALVYALDGCHAKSRRCRHQNLFNTIRSDLNLGGYSLNCIEDLYLARDVARDKRNEVISRETK
jgi:hypothetical protein